MIDQHFLSPPAPEAFGDLQSGERVLWHGRCGVAEYAFEQPESMPRWTLPESTEVVVTDRRVRYSLAALERPERLGRRGSGQEVLVEHARPLPSAPRPDRGRNDYICATSMPTSPQGRLLSDRRMTTLEADNG